MRDVKFRTTVEVVCDVAPGDDTAALDEARAAVKARAEGENHSAAPAVVRWRALDGGVLQFYAVVSERTGSSAPVFPRPSTTRNRVPNPAFEPATGQRTEPGDPASIHDGVDPGDVIAGSMDMTGGGLTTARLNQTDPT